MTHALDLEEAFGAPSSLVGRLEYCDGSKLLVHCLLVRSANNVKTLPSLLLKRSQNDKIFHVKCNGIKSFYKFGFYVLHKFKIFRTFFIGLLLLGQYFINTNLEFEK